MPRSLDRRLFLQTLAALAPAAALGAKTSEPALQGVYPIMQTPYLASGGVDHDTLAKEVEFLDKTGTHGIVWPQLASEYALLTFDERIQGAETIVQAGRGLKPKTVIGVQAEDVDTAVKYAKHAAKIRPDAIIALPPRKADQQEFEDLDKVRDYYVAIGKACDRPMFIQAIGNITTEFVLDLMEKVPSLQYIKDEAGHTLTRVSELRKTPTPHPLGVFTGGHGKTLIDEMARGSHGTMPAASWVDLYAQSWDLWHAGFEPEAIDLFSKTMLFITQVQAYGLVACNYVLHLRGVFPRWDLRQKEYRPLDDEAKVALRRTLDFVEPYLRA